MAKCNQLTLLPFKGLRYEGKLQIATPPVENLWLRQVQTPTNFSSGPELLYM